jgi:hypothetical protein
MGFLIQEADCAAKTVLAEADRGAGFNLAGADDHHAGAFTRDSGQPMSIMTLPASTFTG